jgi:hypothetical protein
MQGRDCNARLLEPGEIAEHVANVDGAIDHLRQYRRIVRGDGAPDIPQPPRPT